MSNLLPSAGDRAIKTAGTSSIAFNEWKLKKDSDRKLYSGDEEQCVLSFDKEKNTICGHENQLDSFSDDKFNHISNAFPNSIPENLRERLTSLSIRLKKLKEESNFGIISQNKSESFFNEAECNSKTKHDALSSSVSFHKQDHSKQLSSDIVYSHRTNLYQNEKITRSSEMIIQTYSKKKSPRMRRSTSPKPFTFLTDQRKDWRQTLTNSKDFGSNLHDSNEIQQNIEETVDNEKKEKKMTKRQFNAFYQRMREKEKEREQELKELKIKREKENNEKEHIESICHKAQNQADLTTQKINEKQKEHHDDNQTNNEHGALPTTTNISTIQSQKPISLSTPKKQKEQKRIPVEDRLLQMHKIKLEEDAKMRSEGRDLPPDCTFTFTRTAYVPDSTNHHFHRPKPESELTPCTFKPSIEARKEPSIPSVCNYLKQDPFDRLSCTQSPISVSKTMNSESALAERLKEWREKEKENDIYKTAKRPKTRNEDQIENRQFCQTQEKLFSSPFLIVTPRASSFRQLSCSPFGECGETTPSLPNSPCSFSSYSRETPKALRRLHSTQRLSNSARFSTSPSTDLNSSFDSFLERQQSAITQRKLEAILAEQESSQQTRRPKLCATSMKLAQKMLEREIKLEKEDENENEISTENDIIGKNMKSLGEEKGVIIEKEASTPVDTPEKDQISEEYFSSTLSSKDGLKTLSSFRVPSTPSRSIPIVEQHQLYFTEFLKRTQNTLQEKETKAILARAHEDAKKINDCTFTPLINKKSKQRRSKGVKGLVDDEMKKRREDEVRLKIEQEMKIRCEAPFTPQKISKDLDVSSKLDLRKSPDTLIERLKKEKEAAILKVEKEEAERRRKCNSEITFKPKIHKMPEKVKQITDSHKLLKMISLRKKNN